MVTIDPPLTPPRLYRYRAASSVDSAKQELDAILGNYIWCSKFCDLNDTMEGYYGVSASLSRWENYEKITKQILNNKHKIGISCFSDTYENELMWAHYANNYKGICIEYSTNDLLSGLDDRVHLVRVAYSQNPPRIGVNFGSKIEEAARGVLSHKKYSWNYEREWRILAGFGNKKLPGPLKLKSKNPVKSVFIGIRVRKKIINIIRKKLSKLGIPVYGMEILGYEHNWTEYNALR